MATTSRSNPFDFPLKLPEFTSSKMHPFAYGKERFLSTVRSEEMTPQQFPEAKIQKKFLKERRIPAGLQKEKFLPGPPPYGFPSPGYMMADIPLFTSKMKERQNIFHLGGLLLFLLQQSVPIISNDQKLFKLGLVLGLPQERVVELAGIFGDPAICLMAILEDHMFNSVTFALVKIGEKELAEQVHAVVTGHSPLDYVRVDNSLLHKKLLSVKSKWRSIGQGLGFPPSELDKIKKSEKSDRLLKVLQQYDEKHRLIEALRSIDESKLAAEVAKEQGCLIKTLAPFALNTTEWNDLKPRLKISDKEEDEMMRDMTRIGVSRSLHLVLMKRFEHDQPHYSTVESLKALVEKLEEFVSTHDKAPEMGEWQWKIPPDIEEDVVFSAVVKERVIVTRRIPQRRWSWPDLRILSIQRSEREGLKQGTKAEASIPPQPAEEEQGHHYEDTDDSSSASEMEMPVRVPKTVDVAPGKDHEHPCSQPTATKPPESQGLQAEQSLGELPLEDLLQQMLLEDARISAPRGPNEQDETLSEDSDWSSDWSLAEDNIDEDDVPAGGSAEEGHPDLPPSTEPQKLSEMPYRQYMDMFDEVFANGFSVQDNVAAAIIQKGGDVIKGIDLGVKFVDALVPDTETERRDELRPCLKVFVSESVDDQAKDEIAKAVVETIETKHKKQFRSEDHEAWLDFIPAIKGKISIAEMLSDRSEEATPLQPEIKPGVQFEEPCRGTLGMLVQNCISIEKRSRHFHHGLTCAHCILPPVNCEDILQELKSQGKLGEFETLLREWERINLPGIFRDPSSLVRFQNLDLPQMGLSLECGHHVACNCQQEAEEQYTNLRKWMTLATLLPGQTISQSRKHGPKLAPVSGVCHGCFPSNDLTLPIWSGPTQATRNSGKVTVGSFFNMDIGAVSLNVEKASKHTIKDVGPPDLKWKTAEKFEDILPLENPIVGRRYPPLPVYALTKKGLAQISPKCLGFDIQGELMAAHIFVVSDTQSNHEDPYLKPGDSGSIVYTVHRTNDSHTAIAFGMLYAGGQVHDKKQYVHVFPLYTALEVLKPQLNYSDAQRLSTRKIEVEQYILKFEKAEKYKCELLGRLSSATKEDQERILEGLQQVHSMQCNKHIPIRGLSFELRPCTSVCGKLSSHDQRTPAKPVQSDIQRLEPNRSLERNAGSEVHPSSQTLKESGKDFVTTTEEERMQWSTDETVGKHSTLQSNVDGCLTRKMFTLAVNEDVIS